MRGLSTSRQVRHPARVLETTDLEGKRGVNMLVMSMGFVVMLRCLRIVYQELNILFGEWKAVSGVEQVSWKSEGWTSIGNVNVRVCIPAAK